MKQMKVSISVNQKLKNWSSNMPNYKAYRTVKDTPSRKQRKGQRASTFAENKAASKDARKARREARREGEK